MSKSDNACVKTGSRAHFPGRKVILSIVVLLAALSGGTGFYIWHRRTAVEPPAINLTGADPALVRAIESANAEVGRSPRSGRAWGKLGMVLYAHYYLDEATVCFKEAEKLDLSEPRWPYYQGGILQHSDLDAAIACFRRAARLTAGEPDSAAIALAETLISADRLDEAEQELSKLLKKNNARAELDLGRLAYLRGDRQGSIRHLELAAHDEHTRQAARLLMAQVYQSGGNSKAAQEQRRLATDAPADVPWPTPYDAEISNLGTGESVLLAEQGRLMEAGQVPQAVALLERTVQEYPQSARAWGLLGDGFIKVGDFGRAEQALNEAMRLGSDSLEVPYDLGLVCFRKGNHHDALPYFRQAVARKPDYAWAHFFIGRCLIQEGDRQAALEEFEAASRSKPDFIQAHISCAELLVAERKYAGALQHLRYVQEFGPADPKAKKLLQEVLQRVQIPVGF